MAAIKMTIEQIEQTATAAFRGAFAAATARGLDTAAAVADAMEEAVKAVPAGIHGTFDDVQMVFIVEVTAVTARKQKKTVTCTCIKHGRQCIHDTMRFEAEAAAQWRADEPMRRAEAATASAQEVARLADRGAAGALEREHATHDSAVAGCRLCL